MARARLSTTLERDQDEDVLRREWRFERAGWFMLALLLAAGLGGAFGNGALASASVSSVNGAAVLRYDRFIRHGAPTTMELRLAPTTGVDSVIVVSLDDEYLARMSIDRVTPEPLRVRASGERVDYHLLRLDQSRSMVIRFSMQAGTMGTRRATLGTDHGPLEFHQFVLP